MISIEKPPGSYSLPWPFWVELAGMATIGFACGLIVGYIRAPSAQRNVVNQIVMERVSDRTRTVLAILKVSTGYWDDEIEAELKCPGDIIQEALVVPIDGEKREVTTPQPYHPAAY